MVKLLFLRHGESEYNRIKKYTGQLNVKLTDTGILQAKIASEYILQNYKVDAVYSSDLSRAVDTVTPIASALNLPIYTDKRLREFDLGEWTDLYFVDVVNRYKEEFENYKKGGSAVGGESVVDVQRRAYDCVLQIVKENVGKTVLIGTHGGVIRALLLKFLNYSSYDVKKLPIVSNNSITVVNYDNDNFIVEKVSYNGYLDSIKTVQDKNLL